MNIVETAQRMMHLFYQDYKSNDDFFDLEDFIPFAGAAYGTILQDMFDKKRAEMRNEGENGYVDLPGEWLIEQEIKLEKAVMSFTLPERPMSFLRDENSIGIQHIEAGNGCGRFHRARISEKWKAAHFPPTKDVWYYLVGDRVRFLNNPVCQPEAVTIFYVPNVNSKNLNLSDAALSAVWDMGITLMKKSKEGVIVDKTNDGNPNKTIETEVNKDQLK
jgi:hypothetical protein